MQKPQYKDKEIDGNVLLRCILVNLLGRLSFVPTECVKAAPDDAEMWCLAGNYMQCHSYMF